MPIPRSGFIPLVRPSFYALPARKAAGAPEAPGSGMKQWHLPAPRFGGLCPRLGSLCDGRARAIEARDYGRPYHPSPTPPCVPHRHARRARSGIGNGKARPGALSASPVVAGGRPVSADPGGRFSRPSPSPGAGPASPQRLVVYPRRDGNIVRQRAGTGKNRTDIFSGDFCRFEQKQRVGGEEIVARNEKGRNFSPLRSSGLGGYPVVSGLSLRCRC